jgi:hypothetical protein
MFLGSILSGLLEWMIRDLFFLEKNLSSSPIVPITTVHHKEDGAWEFFRDNYQTKSRITSIDEASKDDSTLKKLIDLPAGYSAKRVNVESAWEIYKTSERK